MNDHLKIRNNIIDKFYRNFRYCKIDATQDHLVILTSDDGSLHIERNMTTGQVLFGMMLSATQLMQNNEPYTISRDSTQYINGMVSVMSYLDGTLSMIDTSKSDWLETKIEYNYNTKLPTSFTPVLVSKMGLTLDNLPITEEAHFQRMTVDDLVLGLEECKKVNEMVETLFSLKNTFKLDNNLTVNFYFTELLRGDA